MYGLNYVIAKTIMPEYLSPRAIIMLRVLGAVLFFWLLHAIFIKQKVEKKDIPRLAFCALFGVAINQILFFEGLNLSSPINASLIMLIVPILVLIASHFLLKESITANKVIGIIIGIGGALILVLGEGKISFKSAHFTGNLLLFINASAFGFYLVLVKPMMVRYHPLTVMNWVFLFGLIYITPFCLEKAIHSDYSAIPLKIWFSIAYVIIGTTILAYLLFNYSLKFVSPVVSSMYMYLQPVLAGLVAIIIGADTLSLIEVIAAAMVFSGVYFVSIRKRNGINRKRP